MRLTAALLLLSATVLAVAATAAPAGRPVPVTFVGDSVPASITYTPAAKEELGRGLRLKLDLRVCRRLVQASCSFQGATPSTALRAVQHYGRGLGRVLVIGVGYNESADGYPHGIDLVMRAALRQGARRVVWVTLRETRDVYRSTNVAIRAAARRWPELVVADWNAYSSGRPWFRRDGLHLTGTGAEALASFLRRYVDRAAAGV